MPEPDQTMPPEEAKPLPEDFNIQERMTPKELEDVMNRRSEAMRKLEAEVAKRHPEASLTTKQRRQMCIDAELEEVNAIFAPVQIGGGEDQENINLIRNHAKKLSRLIVESCGYAGVRDASNSRQAVNYVQCAVRIALCTILEKTPEDQPTIGTSD